MKVSLRPNNLEDFKGKQTIKENIKIYIKSALQNHTSLDHCLFYGLAGTGKTTLAMIIANELKQNIKIVQGNSIQKTTDIINLALTLKENDVLFIDEIHAINSQIVELFYSILEDFSIDICLGKDFNSKTTRIKIPKFTLIGATTNLGKIPESLEERFGINIFFDQYSNKEMEEIVNLYAKKLNLKLKNKEIELIAKNSKGIPRIANKIVRRIYDFMSLNIEKNIQNILNKLGIRKNGINDLDLNYLNTLNEFGIPLSVKTISHSMMLDEKTIENKIEPYLIYCKFISKTSRGRTLTKTGKDFLSTI